MNRLIAAIAAAFGILLIAFAPAVYAQIDTGLQNYRSPDKAGINVFEEPKATTADFQQMVLRVGGDFSMQFQGLRQSNDADDLVDLANNLSLPTANLNVDVQFDDGLRMHLRTYLSSRHHEEAWVKGGYLQIDNLNFISEGFLSEVMEVGRIKVGMDEINYGDAHFRRSDNAKSIHNPFVDNYIMDSFTTEPHIEVMGQRDGFLGMLGVSNGRLNQRPIEGDDGFVVYGKVGFDRQLNEELRVRLTGSVYNSTSESTRDYLYGGDRAGSRYYNILETEDSASDFLPRFNPGFPYHTAVQINPFVKYLGAEFFGVFEVTGNGADVGGSYTQLGGELVYRFGRDENLYVGGRYNLVDGESADGADPQEITRFNIAAGWFLTNNVLSKVEYVHSTYDGAGFTGKFAGAEFSGVVVEAVVSF